MGTLPAVRAVDLGLVLAAVAGLAVLRWAVLRRRAIPGGVARLAQAIPDAFGDGVLGLDGEGRVVLANRAAARLTGTPVADLVDQRVGDVAPELAALARGLELGPADARLVLPGTGVHVHAAVARVSARPPWSLAVLRPLPPPPPPPLPAHVPAPWPAGGEARRGLAAAAAALRDPVGEGADALSLLRLAAPPLPPAAAAALAAAEAALLVAARRVAALAAAGQPATRRAVDLAALAEDLVDGYPAPPGVRLRCDLAPARAVVDERAVRAALRELLGAAAAALPAGGEVAVTVRAGPAAARLELRAPGGVAPGGVALARALLSPQGAGVEEEEVAGRGTTVRLVLEGAPALAPA